MLNRLRADLQVTANKDVEDQELVMRLSPLFDQQLEQAKQQARQEGQRGIIENLLALRFGSLDEELTAIIEPLLTLPSAEFTRLLLQLSREELLSRFGE
jgi:hypothetical protein